MTTVPRAAQFMATVRRRISRRHHRAAAGGARYLILIILVVLTLYPVLWMFFGSLKSNAEFYTNIWGPPVDPAWVNYVDAWTRADIGRKFLNSLIVTLGSLALVVPITSLAGYVFARMSFPGRRVLFGLILLGIAIPQGATAIPIFTLILNLGLLNSLLGLILVYAASGIAFGTFFMAAFFHALPRELEEAALVDGCTRLGAFVRVILPLSRPALATLVVFLGIGAWNEYFMASILIRSSDLQTLPIGVVQFVGRYATDFPKLFATLAITTIPVLIVYFVAQRQFIAGLTAGAMKD